LQEIEGGASGTRVTTWSHGRCGGNGIASFSVNTSK
jgi:hypothetical protein